MQGQDSVTVCGNHRRALLQESRITFGATKEGTTQDQVLPYFGLVGRIHSEGLGGGFYSSSVGREQSQVLGF